MHVASVEMFSVKSLEPPKIIQAKCRLIGEEKIDGWLKREGLPWRMCRREREINTGRLNNDALMDGGTNDGESKNKYGLIGGDGLIVRYYPAPPSDWWHRAPRSGVWQRNWMSTPSTSASWMMIFFLPSDPVEMKNHPDGAASHNLVNSVPVPPVVSINRPCKQMIKKNEQLRQQWCETFTN